MIFLRAKIPHITSSLVIIMVVAIPLVGTFDVIESFRSGMGLEYLQQVRGGGERVGSGLLYMREILLLLLIGILFMWLCRVGQPLPRLPGVGFLMVCVGISFIVSIVFYPWVISLVGLRQLTYPLLVYALYLLNHESDHNESLFVRAIAGIAVVEFIVAVIQMVLFAVVLPALLGGRVRRHRLRLLRLRSCVCGAQTSWRRNRAA